MRPYDELILLGNVAAYPDKRYSLSHIEPHHLREPWMARAWRTLHTLADADERAEMLRPIRIERLFDAVPDLMEQRAALATAWADGKRLYDEADAAADRVVCRWQSRRYAEAARSIIAYHEQGEADGDPRTALEAIGDQWTTAEHEATAAGSILGVYSPQQLGEAVHETLTARANDPEGAWGIRSGWPAWDRAHRGARPGRAGLTIAPTGQGKTSFLLNLATQIAQSAPALYINLEMMAEDIATRQAAIALRDVPLDQLESGGVAPHEIEDAAVKVSESRLHITTPAEKTAGTIASLMARYAVRHGVRWVCVDHLLEVTLTAREERDGPHWRHHVKWARIWHNLARRYGFTLEIVGMCGTADMDFKAGHEPSFVNMQGAKAVLNHLDVGRILWRQEDGTMGISIKKNRGGVAPVRIDYEFRQTHGTWSELHGR